MATSRQGKSAIAADPSSQQEQAKNLDAGLSYTELVSSSSLAAFLPSSSAPLPILVLESQLGRLLNSHQSVLVLGETSCGKSTQVPQMVHRLGWTKNGFRIAVVQPNRVTAQRLAERIAAEMGTDEYAEAIISQEEETERRRRISRRSGGAIVVFDRESFLRSALAMDPKLAAFSLVFLDEIHDRSVSLDIVMGLMKRLLEFRPDLRLILASATLDMHSITRFYPSCAVLVSEGRQYPVYVSYLTRACSDYLDTCVRVIKHLHQNEPRAMPGASGGGGDILVFLPGRDECEELVRQVHDYQPSELMALPLHEGMTMKDQQLVLSFCGSSSSSPSSNKRKVIAATQIAETALTIPNITYVIDAMYTREMAFDAPSGLMSLRTRAVSRSKADQRAGRAGRMAPNGKALRLCTERDFFTLLPKHDQPEILHSDLVDVVLTLKSFGIDDVVDFPFLTQPPVNAFVRAFDILFALGAMNEEAELTELGFQLARLPLPIQLGKALLTAISKAEEEDPSIGSRMLDLVAIIGSSVAGSALSSASISTLQLCAAREGDHLTLCNMADLGQKQGQHRTMSYENFERFRSYRVHIKRTLAESGIQFRESHIQRTIAKTKSAATEEGRTILRCALSGIFTQVAKLQSNGLYKTTRDGRQVRLHESCVLARFGKPPEWIAFHEAVLMSSARHSLLSRAEDSDVAVVRIVSAIDPRWLLEIAPHFWMRAKTH